MRSASAGVSARRTFTGAAGSGRIESSGGRAIPARRSQRAKVATADAA
jgi:hypothetical protein